MNKKLTNYIEKVVLTFDKIPDERKKLLRLLANYIKQNYVNKTASNIIFICTHNSRRSQLAQCWGYASSQYYDLKNINVFSGGTEVTSFNINALNAMKHSGFTIDQEDSKKKFCVIKVSEKDKGQKCYSKKYDSKDNPVKNFISIMTCIEADGLCPVLYGSDLKVSIPYKDPKTSDGTKDEFETYRKVCFEIAQELFYVMKKVKTGD